MSGNLIQVSKPHFIMAVLLVNLLSLACSRPIGIVHQDVDHSQTFRKFTSEFELEAAAALIKVNADDPPSVPLIGDDALALSPVQSFRHDRVKQGSMRTELGGFMVVGTVDGRVHAMDPSSGEVRWSFSTGEPLVKSYQQLPGVLEEKRWLIPTLDGKMLVHTTQGLRRPGLDARQLVEQTPFLAPGGTFYTGSKISRVYGVDAQTGEVRQVISGASGDSLETHRRLLKQSNNVVWIGRIDHTVRAFDVPTGNEQWNLTIGEFVSLEGLDLASSHGGVSETSHALGPPRHRSAPPVVQLVATPEGALRANAHSAESATGEPVCLWDVPLPSHVSSVFGVSLENNLSGTAYLPMRSLPLSHSPVTRDVRSSPGSAAVGLLDNGQLYAVMLGEHGHGGGEDEGDGSGGGGGS
ncbi:unnamed protein product, partial [Choristocarpus tenellus]